MYSSGTTDKSCHVGYARLLATGHLRDPCRLGPRYSTFSGLARMTNTNISYRKILQTGLLLMFVRGGCSLGTTAAIVTGATDGIGVTTAKNLAAQGNDVIIHGRSVPRIESSAKKIKEFASCHSSNPGRVFTLPPRDLSLPSECACLAQDAKQLCHDENLSLGILMNNAGVFSDSLVVTKDGLEQTFAVNVVAPFVITSMLLPTLLEHTGSRIVIASSISQCATIRRWGDLNYSERTFSAHASYSESKLMDAMLALEISDRLVKQGFDPKKISCNCLDPGTVNTKMLLAGWGPCGIDVEEALDQTWLCSSNELDGITGKYFVYKSDRPAQKSAYDLNERSKLWKLLSGIAPHASNMWNFDFSAQSG